MAKALDGLAPLREIGFDITYRSFADALLGYAFEDVAANLVEVLSSSTIPVSELVAGGGGVAPFTQRLRNALYNKGWKNHEFNVAKLVDGIETISQSHEVDHVKSFAAGSVALEIEWNNKDPFFDRDLENFSRLHSDNAIALGIIITRGSSLQSSLFSLVESYAHRHGIDDIYKLEEHLESLDRGPTRRQKRNILDAMDRRPDQSFEANWARLFVNDKYGIATTHWTKLLVRLERGVGRPCPLVGIGLPASVVSMD